MSLTLDQAQAIHSEIRQIRDLLIELAGGAPTMGGGGGMPSTGKMREAGFTAQEATRILFRFNHDLSHMFGANTTVDGAISKLQQFTFKARMAQQSGRWIDRAFDSNLSRGQRFYGGAMGTLGYLSVILDLVAPLLEDRNAKLDLGE